MNIPLPPAKTKLVQDDGTMHPHWLSFFSNLHLQLSSNLGNDGYTVPTLANEHFPTLESDKDKSKQPRIIHGKTDGKYYVNILSDTGDSTYKAITTE